MKKICVAVTGTRGDVFPVLSLIELIKKNNDVKAVSSPENASLFREQNIDFFPTGADFAEVVKSGDLNQYRRQVETQFDSYREIYEETDMIIGAGLFYAGRTLAEHFGKKYYHLFYTPQVLKSNLYAPPGNKRPYRNKMRNKLLWFKNYTENNYILKRLINKKREELGLTRIKSVYDYFIDQPDVIIAVDKELAQIPSVYASSVKQIGFLQHEDTRNIDKDLQAFLKIGSKPVLINFGSAELAMKEFKNFLKDTIDSVRELGHSVVIISKIKISGYESDKNIFFCDYAPLAALLPKISLIIHHGGIGTVYISLKKGIPQIIVPQILDQYFWAEIVLKKKLGKIVYNDTKTYTSHLKEALINLLNDSDINNNINKMCDLLNGDRYYKENLEKLREAMPECFEK